MTTSSLPMTHRAHLAAATLRDELRTRRAARAEQRRVRRELATFTTAKDIEDLLFRFDEYDGAQVEAMRSVLHRNLQQIRLAG